jgi:organic radical activating enzyme
MKQLNFDLSPKPPKISQNFISLEGEGNAIGQPSIYIRLAGCYSAACSFCDTKFSWGDKAAPNKPNFHEIGSRELTLEIADELNRITPKRMTVTGGEPLHYMEYFPDIFKWINSISPTGLDFFGIESNGNLLKDREKCMTLIQSFNEIILEHGVVPTLTISPKLDAKTCYEDQLTQDQVDKMYFEAFKNVSDYLQTYPIYFKFIYEYTETIVDFQHDKIFIDYLLDELGVPRKNIMLMPFTPDDPLGKDNEVWSKSMDATARKALELGVTYSPRIHIDRKLD